MSTYQMLFSAVAAGGLICGLLALFYVAPTKGGAWNVFIRGPLAGRDAFTEKGWKYRNASLTFFLLGMALLLVAGLFD